MSLAQAQRPREPALQQLAFLKELSQAASDRGRRSTMPWLSTAIILAAAVATAHEDNAHDHRDLGIVIKNVYGAMACGEACVLEPHRASVVGVTRGDADAKVAVATVIEPKNAFYEVPIATRDVASLYPSIMQASVSRGVILQRRRGDGSRRRGESAETTRRGGRRGSKPRARAF